MGRFSPHSEESKRLMSEAKTLWWAEQKRKLGPDFNESVQKRLGRV